MSINLNEVDKLAGLSRIELDPEKKQKYMADLSAILQYVGKLQEVRAEAAPAEENSEESLRPDQVVGISSEDQQELVKAAPETEGGLIKTKAVFE